MSASPTDGTTARDRAEQLRDKADLLEKAQPFYTEEEFAEEAAEETALFRAVADTVDALLVQRDQLQAERDEALSRLASLSGDAPSEPPEGGCARSPLDVTARQESGQRTPAPDGGSLDAAVARAEAAERRADRAEYARSHLGELNTVERDRTRRANERVGRLEEALREIVAHEGHYATESCVRIIVDIARAVLGEVDPPGEPGQAEQAEAGDAGTPRPSEGSGGEA